MFTFVNLHFHKNHQYLELVGEREPKCLLLICHHFFYSLVYINVRTLLKQPIEKSIQKIVVRERSRWDWKFSLKDWILKHISIKYICIYSYYSILDWLFNCLFHFYQNLPPDRKELPALREKPDPTRFLDPHQTVPELSKIRPRDPIFFGIARSGPGIPEGPGRPSRLYYRDTSFHEFPDFRKFWKKFIDIRNFFPFTKE